MTRVKNSVEVLVVTSHGRTCSRTELEVEQGKENVSQPTGVWNAHRVKRGVKRRVKDTLYSTIPCDLHDRWKRLHE